MKQTKAPTRSSILLQVVPQLEMSECNGATLIEDLAVEIAMVAASPTLYMTAVVPLNATRPCKPPPPKFVTLKNNAYGQIWASLSTCNIDLSKLTKRSLVDAPTRATTAGGAQYSADLTQQTSIEAYFRIIEFVLKHYAAANPASLLNNSRRGGLLSNSLAIKSMPQARSDLFTRLVRWVTFPVKARFDGATETEFTGDRVRDHAMTVEKIIIEQTAWSKLTRWILPLDRLPEQPGCRARMYEMPIPLPAAEVVDCIQRTSLMFDATSARAAHVNVFHTRANPLLDTSIDDDTSISQLGYSLELYLYDTRHRRLFCNPDYAVPLAGGGESLAVRIFCNDNPVRINLVSGCGSFCMVTRFSANSCLSVALESGLPAAGRYGTDHHHWRSSTCLRGYFCRLVSGTRPLWKKPGANGGIGGILDDAQTDLVWRCKLRIEAFSSIYVTNPSCWPSLPRRYTLERR